MPDAEKLSIAKQAFAYVADEIPEGNPLRAELERFAKEALVLNDADPSAETDSASGDSVAFPESPFPTFIVVG